MTECTDGKTSYVSHIFVIIGVTRGPESRPQETIGMYAGGKVHESQSIIYICKYCHEAYISPLNSHGTYDF